MPNKHYQSNKKWRKNNPSIWNEMKKRNYKRTRELVEQPEKPRQWEKWENDAIIDSNRPSDRVLSRKINRSVQAIQVQRSRLKSNAYTHQYFT